MKKSTKNKEIRKKQTLNHITGRKPFSVVRVEETNKKNGVPATRLEVWMAGYSKDNKPSNDKVVEVMTQMKDLGAQSNDTDEEIITQVLGPERPGRVRTYGLGPSPTDIFGDGYRQSQEQTCIIQTQVQEQLNQYKAQMEMQMKEMMDVMLNQQKVQMEMQSTIQAQQARIEQLESQQAMGGPVAPAATHVHSQQQSHAYTSSFNCHRSSEEEEILLRLLTGSIRGAELKGFSQEHKTYLDEKCTLKVLSHVGWWSPTIIRGDDRETIHIPNHKFTMNVLRNLSQKTHWRIKTYFAISHLDVNKINIPNCESSSTSSRQALKEKICVAVWIYLSIYEEAEKPPGDGKIKGDIYGVSKTTVVEKVWVVAQAIGDIAFAFTYNIILLEIEVYAAFGNQTPGNLLTGFGFYEPYWLVDFANACVVLHLVGGYQTTTASVSRYSYFPQDFYDSLSNFEGVVYQTSYFELCRDSSFREQHPKFWDFLKRACTKLVKVLVAVQSRHPYSFGDKSVLPPVMDFCLNKITDPEPDVMSFEQFLIQCMKLVKSVLECKEYKPSLTGRVMDENAVTLEQMKKMFLVLLLVLYFVLTATDLEVWYQNPESFHHEQDSVLWSEKLRPCAEALYIVLFENHSQLLGAVVVSILQEAMNGCPTSVTEITPGLLLKDAAYGAVAYVYYELSNYLSFKEWIGEKLEPLSWDLRIQIAVDVARALEYLHDGRQLLACIEMEIGLFIRRTLMVELFCLWVPMKVMARTGNAGVSSSKPNVVNIGALYTFNSIIGRSAKPAIEAAVDDVNSDSTVLVGMNTHKEKLIHISSFEVYSQPLFAEAERWITKKLPDNEFVNNVYTIKLPMLPVFKLNLLRLCFRTTYVASTTGIALLFPYFNDVLGVLGALNFWPLAIYFPAEMYLRQRNIKAWTRMWVVFQAFRAVCLVVTIVAFVGSMEGLITTKLSCEMSWLPGLE
ncbi:unnamed protein product [Camellia sinensis]